MNRFPLLERIKKQAHRIRLSPVEKKRFLKDLEAVHQRLIKRDYQKTGFSMNTFDVPNRAKEVFTEVEFYTQLGKTWSYILEAVGVHKFSEVADLCPGYTPKVELGLYYLRYAGHVVILDKNPDAMAELQKFIALFQPTFAISSYKANLFQPIKKSYPLVVANHAIDDLVIGYFSHKQVIPLARLYETEGALVALWKQILAREDTNLQEVLPILTDMFTRVVAPGGILCITQYKSYMEEMLDLSHATHFNRTLFQLLAKALKQSGFVAQPHILTKAFTGRKGHFTSRDCIILKKSL